MAESFAERRRRELGLTSGSATEELSFVERRKMELGMIPDTRPKQPSLPEASAEGAAASKQYADAMKSAYQSNPSAFTPAPAPAVQAPQPTLPGRDLPVIGAGLRMLDRLADNPISKAVAEYTVPDAPMIDPNAGVFSGATLPGTNARQQFLDRSGQEAATGVPKFIGQAASPFFVSGAQLGSGTALSEGAESLLTRYAPQLNGLGRVAAREGMAGATIGFGSEYAQGTADPLKATLSGAYGAVGGAAGGVALEGIARAIGAAGNSASRGLTSALQKDKVASQLSQTLPDTELAKIADEGLARLAPDTNPNIVAFDPRTPIRSAAPETARITPLEQVQPPSATVASTPPAQAAPVITPQPSPTAKTGMQERGLSKTLRASEKTPQGFKDGLQAMYRQTSNEETLAAANNRLNKDVEEATSFVLGNSRFTAEKAATAQRLIDHYNNTGNIQRAVDIAEKASEEATRAGQAIQALSMFNRLSPEGVLVYAQRLAKKTNENMPVGAKEVKVTADMAASITGLARASQRMTGVKDLANDVMSILEKAKTGDALTDSETAALKRFVEESKQFVKETSRKPKPPRPPQQPKDKRVRDNVVSFLDAQEQAAKERLRARGIQVSSTPLDVWADYAVIGAAKMAKGVVKFSDWSEQMVKELGEDIRPHLDKLYDRAKEAFEASTKKVTKETISEAEKLTEKVIRSKQLDQNAANSLRTLAKKVSKLSGDAKQTASQDLQAVLQALDKPSLLKKVSSAQTIGQLLNPKTQVRNALGNELFYRIERLNKLMATPIDIVRSKITGGERTVTFRTNNQGEYWRNWMRGAKAGWKGVNVNGLETQYDLASPAFKSKYNPLKYMEKALGAALKSFDTAAYMRAYNNTLGELATLRAVNEGKGGDKELIQQYIREADDNMLKIADEYGRYVTLQDSNVISNSLVAAKRGMNFGKEWGLGDIILKYPKTPGNILMRALEYSPAGFIRSASILARPWFKQEPNSAEVTQALSRAIIGTFGFTGMGYFLMDKGVITGSASKDRDIRDLQKSAGQGQYQVNLSALGRLVMSGFDASTAKLQQGDLLYTYDWMQPVSIAASIGANISKNMSAGKQKFEGALGTAYNSIDGGLSTLTEQSVLSGLKSAAEGYPGQTVTDKIMDILSDVPASFVPTVFNQTKQLTDNSKPETYSPDKLTQSLNKAQAKIPGLAGKLPKQYDTLGREKEAYQDNSVFNVLFNPGFASRYELSPEAQLVVDLIAETGDETVAPRVPGKTVTIEDPKDKSKTINIKLTGEQYSRYQQLQGEETRKEIGRRFKTEGSEKSRLERMNSILRNAGDRAKKQIKKELK